MSLTIRLSLLFFLLISGPLLASTAVIPTAPKLSATGYILRDFHSGHVLAEQNAHQKMEPASLTKLMTAYTVFQELEKGRIQLSDKVRVSEKAWRMPGSRMFIEVDTQVTVEELLKGLIIQSGNDASVALAEHVAGSEEAFLLLMNANARNLGLTGTHFVNSTGLPVKDHYSTPADLSLLAAALIRDFPKYYSWYSEKKYIYNNISQHNRNRLLWRDESVDGVKTGHTDSAGYCLIASADREGMRLISVVMGTKSEEARASESQKLLNYGFRFFETHRLYGASEPLKSMRIWRGAEETIGLGLARELYVTVPRGQYEQLKASMTVDRTIVAPVQAGKTLGMVTVALGEEMVAERPLVALQDVSEGSLVQRLKDNIMLWLE